jgi:hypothetical protein
MLGRPATEEDHRGERWRPSKVSTPPEVDAPGVKWWSGQPAAEGDRG